MGPLIVVSGNQGRRLPSGLLLRPLVCLCRSVRFRNVSYLAPVQNTRRVISTTQHGLNVISPRYFADPRRIEGPQILLKVLLLSALGHEATVVGLATTSHTRFCALHPVQRSTLSVGCTKTHFQARHITPEMRHSLSSSDGGRQEHLVLLPKLAVDQQAHLLHHTLVLPPVSHGARTHDFQKKVLLLVHNFACRSSPNQLYPVHIPYIIRSLHPWTHLWHVYCLFSS